MVQTKEIFNDEKKLVSTEFKQFFLLEFTKQLIFNSAPIEVLKLKEMLKDQGVKISEKGGEEGENQELKEHVKDVLKEEYEKSYMPKIEKQWATPRIERKSFPFESFKNVRLTIPEPNLPERLRYLRPRPAQRDIDIDLGELNPLIRDPYVRTIECQGPNTNILVTGTMGEKETRIILDEQDVNDIIQKFSAVSKIPLHEGVYKVAIGRFIFMAIISDVIGSKFIIKKMLVSQPKMI